MIEKMTVELMELVILPVTEVMRMSLRMNLRIASEGSLSGGHCSVESAASCLVDEPTKRRNKSEK